MATQTYNTKLVTSPTGQQTTVYNPVVTPAVAQGITTAGQVNQPIQPALAPIAPQPITTINASNLAPQAVPVIPTLNTSTIPQTTLGAAVAGAQGMIQPQTTTTFTQPDANTTVLQASGQNDRSAILNRILGLDNTLSTKGDFTAAQNTTQGIDTKTQAVQDLTNQYNARQQYYNDEITKVQASNPLGKSADAIDQQVQQLTRQKNAELADISIQQQAASGNLQVATTLAKNAVDAKFSGIQDQVNLLKDYYTLSENDLSESEKMIAQANIKKQEDAVNFAQQKEFAKYQEQIKEASPDYQLNLQKTRADIANTYSTINARATAGQNSTINGKPQTSVQAQVQGFADRTNQSDAIISNVGSLFTKATSGIGSILPNFLKSSERQQYEQAQKNFVNSVLRRESGAAISESEFSNARQQYFPAPGDSPEVVAQKAANRQTVINNLYQQSNIQRTALPGQIIESAGVQYKVGDDGETLIPIQ